MWTGNHALKTGVSRTSEAVRKGQYPYPEVQGAILQPEGRIMPAAGALAPRRILLILLTLCRTKEHIPCASDETAEGSPCSPWLKKWKRSDRF